MDLMHDLASPIGRKILLSTMGKNDPLMNNALFSLTKRKSFMGSLPNGKRAIRLGTEELSWALPVEAMTR